MTPRFFLLFFCAIHSVRGQLVSVQLGSRLPTTLGHSVASYDGDDSIYIFGGWCEICAPEYVTNDILRYKISTDTIELAARFPKGLGWGSVVNDGSRNYFYFGGYDAFEKSQSIYKFNADDSTILEVGSLPVNSEGVLHAANFQNGGNFYVFGGGLVPNSVLRFDSNTSVTTPTFELPVEMDQVVSFWDEGSRVAHIFGTRRGSSKSRQEQQQALILYDPVTGQSTLQYLSLSDFEFYPRTVWDGTFGYIIGGMYPLTDHIMQYHPPTRRVRSFGVEDYVGGNGTEFWGTGAAYVEGLNRIYLFGGVSFGEEGSRFHDEIWYIDLSPLSKM